VLLGWAVAVAAVHLAAPRWEDVTHDGDFAYLPEQMTSVQGEKLLEAAFPDVLSKSQVVLVVARDEGQLEAGDVGVAEWLVTELTPPDDRGPIVGVLSPWTEVVGQKFVTEAGPNGQALLIILQLRSEFMAIDNMQLMADVYGKLDEARAAGGFPAGLRLGVTGSAAIGYDMLASAKESIRNTEWTTILLVSVILLLVYRAPGLVIVPLLTIAVSVMVALGLVALATQWSDQLGGLGFKVFKTTKIFVVVILFGAGVDYCLFLISRYREELARGRRSEEAVGCALSRVGDALAASALTTIIGLGMMVFASFGKFRNSGPAIALCLAVALVASMTLAPALLRAFGRRVFWPFGPNGLRRGDHTNGAASGSGALEYGDSPFRAFWERLSRQVLARPGLILVVSFLLLSPWAARGFSVEVTYDLLSELRDDRPSVQGTHLLRRHFPPGETGPVVVLAVSQSGGFDGKDQYFEQMRSLAADLYQLEYEDSKGRKVKPVTSIRSLVEPLGERPEKFGLYGALRKGVLRGHPRTKGTYLAQAPRYVGKVGELTLRGTGGEETPVIVNYFLVRDVTRFDLVFQYDPFSVESTRLLDSVERFFRSLKDDPQSDWHGTDFYLTGTAAGIRDLKQVTASDQALIQKLVPIAVLFILILILRRPLVCVYLMLSVLLGYFVTIGATELFFSWLYGDTFHGLDWKVPIFLFVILIAVGQDYNIYLATRVFEEQRRRGPAEGLRVALVRTGGIITSCGVIMAGTFASMTSGTLRTMHELGFALSLGVLLDTFVIRTILVPAFLVLWDRYFPVAVPPESPVPPPEKDSEPLDPPEDRDGARPADTVPTGDQTLAPQRD
ncbi:MAG: MMPL family transporter, partial [Planctomycetota bacterium]